MKKKGPQNPEKTRKRLLRAATIEFSEKGLQGARVAVIAQRAGTNLQAIYYHFGSKEELYAATIEMIYKPERFEALFRDLDELDPKDAILRLIDFMLEQYLDSSIAYTLLLEQHQRHRAHHLKRLPRVRELFKRLIKKVDETLQRGVAIGVFRPGLDAARVFLSITGLTSSYIHKVHIHSALFGRNFSSPDEFGAWRTYIARLILEGIAADPRAGRAVSLPSDLHRIHPDASDARPPTKRKARRASA